NIFKSFNDSINDNPPTTNDELIYTSINLNFSFCEPRLYFIFQRINPKIESSFIIKTFLNTSPYSNCKFPLNNSLSECSHLSIDECKTCEYSKCTTIQCGIVDTMNINKPFVNLYFNFF
ncbi:MAG: hypothetical protein MJ252_30710, partial [archaeon]|nr:hypothetical protein [archaeon]